MFIQRQIQTPPQATRFLSILDGYLGFAYDRRDLREMSSDDYQAFIRGAVAGRDHAPIPQIPAATDIDSNGAVDDRKEGLVWWERQGWIAITEGRISEWKKRQYAQ